MNEQVKLTQHEVMALGMGLAGLIEDFEAIKDSQDIPFTPEARQINKEIYTAAKSAASKIEKMTGFECRIDPYKEGDEEEFLTKQS